MAVLSRWPILTVHQYRLSSRHRPEIVALAAVLDHPGGPLHVAVSCLDWEPEPAAQPIDQTRSLAALLTDPSRDGPLPVLVTADLNAPPATPKIQVLTEVMADAWVAANRTADHGHTMSSSNPLGFVTSIGTASVMHLESRSLMDSAGHRAVED